MIKEITEFVNDLPPEFKSLGAKPKDGLHILLKVQEDGEDIVIDKYSIEYEYFLKKRKEILTPYLRKCAMLQELSWTLDFETKPYYQKCFDLPEKGILTISPFCFSTKKKSFKGGSKYEKDKRKINERIERYFKNTEKLITNSKEKKYHQVLLSYFIDWHNFESYLFSIPEFARMGEEEHIVVYLDLPSDVYDNVYVKYLDNYLFNNRKRFSNAEEELGISNFFNGFNDEKPFLKHCTSSFEYSGLINRTVAKSLKEFKDLLKQNILPNPLPVFVYKDELKKEAISAFKTAAEEGTRISYQAIIESLYNSKYKDELGNYYLLFYQMGEIKDFDFVSKFEYELRDENGNSWEIKDWFNGNNQRKVQNVFDLQYWVVPVVFKNSLVVVYEGKIVDYRYFGELEIKKCKSTSNYLLVQTYRKAFYDYIYKSKRQAISQHAFNTMLQASILDDVHLDEYKDRKHSQERNIRHKLNIWFSLSEKFDLQHKNTETMASKLQVHRTFIRALAKGETIIQTDDEYAFAVGQVVYYLLRKSKTADRSYKRLEPFLQQVHGKELNKAIYRLFTSYKHETFSNNFKNPFAEVMDYETEIKNLQDLMPTMLAGVFSKNELFSDKEEKEDTAVTENEEDID